jgi:hypothetical protein
LVFRPSVALVDEKYSKGFADEKSAGKKREVFFKFQGE